MAASGLMAKQSQKFTDDWFPGLLLILAVVLVYAPVWWAGFVWDDASELTANPVIVGPLGLKEIWSTIAARFYPLVLTTFWVEHKLWGLAPLPYHLVSVFLHGACAVVLWRVLRVLQIPGAWLGAALWALHPVQVESVAWVAEMKNTESGLFYLLTILFFVKWLRANDTAGGFNYALTLLFAALAMAGKSSTVILPLVLMLCAWWVEGRLRWRHLAISGPMLLMSAVAAALALWTVEVQGVNTDTQWALSWPQRLIIAGNAVWFYLGKLLWPHPLMAVYPRWEIDASHGSEYLPLMAVIVVLFIFWLKRGTWARPWFFAFCYFLVALLPVLGLANHFILRYSFVFDHFQYLASMGPLALAGAGIMTFSESFLSQKPRLRTGLCAGLLLLLALTSWQRAWVFESTPTLWTDALAKNPSCWIGHYNLGVVFLEAGDNDKAMLHFQKAVEINPGFAKAHCDFGDTLFYGGDLDKAKDQFEKAIAIDPNYTEAHYNLGHVFLQKGQLIEAAMQFREALRLQPDFSEAQDNLNKVEAMLRQAPASK